MSILILIPFVIQGLAIIFDEYYFHIKRGLPLWERVGHPIDTLSVLACMVFILSTSYSPFHLKWYIALCVLSCLMITKDEWVHKHHCPPSEQWLHALLFINHPIMLTGVGLIWWALTGTNCPPWITSWLGNPTLLRGMLIGQTTAIAFFFFYQVIYWNFIWKEKTQTQ